MKIAVDKSKNFTFQYFKQISLISSLVDVNDIDKLATELKNLRKRKAYWQINFPALFQVFNLDLKMIFIQK